MKPALSGRSATVRLANGGEVHARVDARARKAGDPVEPGIRPEHFGSEGATPARPGDNVGLKLSAQHCHLFDACGRAFPRQTWPDDCVHAV